MACSSFRLLGVWGAGGQCISNSSPEAAAHPSSHDWASLTPATCIPRAHLIAEGSGQRARRAAFRKAGARCCGRAGEAAAGAVCQASGISGRAGGWRAWARDQWKAEHLLCYSCTLATAVHASDGAMLPLPRPLAWSSTNPSPPDPHCCRLRDEGLDNEHWSAAALRYIGGQAGSQTLDQAVAAVKAERQKKTDREDRRTRITELFTQQGLQQFLPQHDYWGGGWGGGEPGAAAGVNGLPAATVGSVAGTACWGLLGPACQGWMCCV